MASTSATIKVASFDVPVGVNPYAWVQDKLLAQMYPTWASGFKGRFVTLLVVLTAVIILSFLYLALYTTETRRKGREWWCWRVIERPAGRYLIINQYVGYPICSIVLGAMWIGYTCWIYSMFGGARHTDPSPLFYFYPFCWIPVFICMCITTFAVLSGANLASKGRTPNSHRLSPWVANTLLIGLPLCMVVAISGAGIWSGRKWQVFAYSWVEAHDAAGVAASQWSGVFDEATKAKVAALVQIRLERYFDFRSSQYISTIIYCLSASVLIVINLTGAVYLLATLRALGGQHRIVPRNEPLVAPLHPFTTGPSALDTTGASPPLTSPMSPILFESKDAVSGSSVLEKKSASSGLKRLEWDVILFFIAVVPACVLFMGFSIFMANNLTVVLTTPRLYEFACIGLIFIYACITLLSLLALTIKTALSIHSSRAHPSRSILGDDTVEANLRRRRAQEKETPASGSSGVGIMVCEWKEIESVYEEPWTGQSTTRGSLPPLYPKDMHPESFVGGEDTF